MDKSNLTKRKTDLCFRLRTRQRKSVWHSLWTVPVLRSPIRRHLQCSVHARTVRHALHQLRYRFKRPRYIFVNESILHVDETVYCF